MSALPGSPERTTAAFTARIQAFRERIEGVLDRALELPDAGTSRLREAMRYSVLGAGKRLRPTLVYLTGESLGAPLTVLDVPAAAVELIHVYSLVHDDLPAMDDDDRSEEHTSELQSLRHLVCRLLLEKKNTIH